MNVALVLANDDSTTFRPRLLRSFGWTVVPVLTRDGFEDADAVMQMLERRLKIALGSIRF